MKQDQPLHVGAVYLGADGKLVDPDIAHKIDVATETAGGNSIQDQNLNLHHEWDDIPQDIGDAVTRELLTDHSRPGNGLLAPRLLTLSSDPVFPPPPR